MVATALTALVIGGCGGAGSSSSSAGHGTPGTPKQGGTLHVAQLGEVTTLDPASAIGAQEIETISQILEPLFRTNAKEEVEPWLVTKYKSSDDDRTWTLQLRPGVKFSDGTPMTAEDVVFSIENAKKSPVWGASIEPISKIRAASPSSVVIEAAEPVPAMPALLCLFAAGIIPKNFGGVSQKEFAQHPIGTGPFRLGKWVRGQSLTLDRNPEYWDKGHPYLDSVVLEAVPDANVRVSRFNGGQLDAIAEPPWSQLSAIESAPDTGVVQFEDGLSDYLILNSEKKIFQDPRSREAVNLAIDREAVVKTAMNGYGKTAGPLTPYSLLYTDPNNKGAAQDIPEAKKLLAEAVKATGEQPNLTLDSIAGDPYAEIASQLLQQELGEAGFKITLQPLEGADPRPDRILAVLHRYQRGVLGGPDDEGREVDEGSGE
jgi:peptide/nickel transport system substrate-binding protein